MTQEEFERNIENIMFEEGWQSKKGRTIKSSVVQQRRSINAIAKAIGLQKLTFERVKDLGFG